MISQEDIITDIHVMLGCRVRLLIKITSSSFAEGILFLYCWLHSPSVTFISVRKTPLQEHFGLAMS